MIHDRTDLQVAVAEAAFVDELQPISNPLEKRQRLQKITHGIPREKWT